MPLFVLIGRDGPLGLERRKLHRAAHLERLEANARAGTLRFAGPLRGEDGAPVGSVVVFEAESLDAARAFAADDPYTHGGVFESTEVFGTLQVLPREE